jgi:hypothetical protein
VAYTSERLERVHLPVTAATAGACGSRGNRSDSPGRGVVLNLMRPDTRSAEGRTPLLRGTPVIPEGEVIQGDHFPLLT